jgi:hypothetical protein
MTINARHRKHWKASSCWKPGEHEAIESAIEKWFEGVKKLFGWK